MRRLVVAVGVLLASSLTALATHSTDGGSPDLVIGSTSTIQSTALPGPAGAVPPPGGVPVTAGGGAPPPVSSVGLKTSDGRAYANAIPFNSSIPVPGELTFVLVIGSDARPGEDIRRTNADSIHLLAVNPTTREGTVVGLPRDAWVDIPGRGKGKINSAMQQGGPSLLVDTVRQLTGLPIQFYALTGFEGLASMVDSLGGVDVLVNRAMNDHFSGARFEQGWHHFNGAQALAFTRNRNDTTNGDFGRSENQGILILAALGKMRAEVGDDGGVRRWVDVLLRHATLEVAADRVLRLAALGRSLDPARLRNLVVPGRIGFAGGQSVVFLGPAAPGLFNDLRDDAVIGGTSEPPPPVAAAPTTTPGATASPPPTQAPLLGGPTTTTPPTGSPTPPTTALLPPINLLPRR